MATKIKAIWMRRLVEGWDHYKHKSWTELAREFFPEDDPRKARDRIRKAVQRCVKNGIIDRKTPCEHPYYSSPYSEREHIPPEPENRKEAKIDLDQWLDHLSDRQELEREAERHQNFLSISIDADGPVVVTFTADWHLGGDIDYQRLKDDFRLMLNEPLLYIGMVGDLIDNYFRFRTLEPVLNQVIPPRLQLDLLEQFVARLVKRRKLLFCAWGNHDFGREEANTGYSYTERLLSSYVPILTGKAIVDLRIGDETYRTLVFHKSRFNSHLDPLHSNRKELRECSLPGVNTVEIVVGAHTHQPAIQCLSYHGRRVVLCKTGTYKVRDPWGERTYGAGTPGNPTVVLFPDRHKIVYFDDPRDALIYAKGVRKQDE